MDGLEATRRSATRFRNRGADLHRVQRAIAARARRREEATSSRKRRTRPLLRAIEKVAGGESFVDPALMPPSSPARSRTRCSPRASAILQLLADGMSNADVACALHQPGDREEPCPAHPREARGRHAHACGRDRPSRGDHRLTSGLTVLLVILVAVVLGGALLHLVVSERRPPPTRRARQRVCSRMPASARTNAPSSPTGCSRPSRTSGGARALPATARCRTCRGSR